MVYQVANGDSGVSLPFWVTSDGSSGWRVRPRPLRTQKRPSAVKMRSVAKGHVWTVPALQEESDV